ncbi:MAG: TSUP family transporter [Oscillibacter sp.]
MGGIWLARLSGGLAGLANGLFGGGGGMVLVPLLSRRLSQRRLYATCVGVIFPVCMASFAVYLFRTELSLLTAAPYVAGGFFGGLVGGKLYGRVSTRWLKWLFAAFLFYGGIQYLL